MVTLRQTRERAISMTEKTLLESSLENAILQTVNGYDNRILEKAPNLDPKDCSALVYSVIGYHLGKCKYFGLSFPLEDGADENELRALSNGYFDIRDGVVRMGVLELQNLEKILRASYIKPGSVHFCEDTWDIDTPKYTKIVQIKKELDLKRAIIKKEFELRIKEFEKEVEQHREKINASRGQRDLDIAKAEQNCSKQVASTLKEKLGEKDCNRLQKWLLEKKKKELQRVENDIQPTENEDYERQLAIMHDDEPEDFAWVYYLDNESKFREELKRDAGIVL